MEFEKGGAARSASYLVLHTNIFGVKSYAIPCLCQKTKRAASKVEVGTKTVDTSMDEWLQVCTLFP